MIPSSRNAPLIRHIRLRLYFLKLIFRLLLPFSVLLHDLLMPHVDQPHCLTVFFNPNIHLLSWLIFTCRSIISE